MRILDADPARREDVLRRSHAIWGEGMTVEDYLAFNGEQARSAWGRDRLRLLVGLDEHGTLLSSLKLYTFPGELEGRPLSVAGIGAVFTPEEARGRGHAASLIEGALVEARAQGCEAALLMSEIGGEYYGRLGFRELPSLEAACMVFLPVPWPKEPAWVALGDPPRAVDGLRPFQPEDLEALVSIHEESTRGQRFRLMRDRRAWEQWRLKTDLGHQLRRDGADHVWVVERAGEVRAYAILKEGRGALLWKEHGARAGAEEILVDLFWSALAHARLRGLGRVEAWHLPAIVTAGRLYPIAHRARRNPVVMLRLTGASQVPPAFSTPEECRVSWLDSF